MRINGYDARARLNGLTMVYISIKVIRYKANQNEGHLSYNHGLKHNTSSTNPHWSALRTSFRLDLSTIQPTLESTLE